LIIQNKIPEVVVGCFDPFEEVNGKGIKKMQDAGIHVEVGISEKECREINQRFFTFHIKHRPFVILKWAQTADGKIGIPLNPSAEWRRTFEDFGSKRLFISNEYSNRLVHKWRSEEAAILVGTNTALMDDPELSTRLWPGFSPIRLVIDIDLRLPSALRIFNRQQMTIVFNTIKHEEENKIFYYKLTKDESVLHQIMKALYKLNIQSVLVEGGAKLLQSFIDEDLWDETRVIKNEKLIINNGVNAPALINHESIKEEKLINDQIVYYSNLKSTPAYSVGQVKSQI
ncbi:MAG: bifunctional diaminohydroxyphosphoribosylaminopyrimidine deaminase/5-amino-6-(5-phosphoribosylamino)uracil reductase, partial [Bacteroidota bacterium]|nr:bifunctional diaminohydroxyphosphoribosylaminopyrimidine deaminase/5-amino-6-(5-phosphoribosylamino)uracil reductase [Bacteroidota bacterium]